MTPEDNFIERNADLFEAGIYPDKGIEVHPEHLDALAASVGEEGVPIQVEHTEGPLKLGKLVRAWRDGNWLRGVIAFQPDAWKLAEASGANKLSVGISRTLDKIFEVSLVQKPRVAGARVYSDRDAGTDPATVYFTMEVPIMGDPQAPANGAVDVGLLEKLVSFFKPADPAPAAPSAPVDFNAVLKPITDEVKSLRAELKATKEELAKEVGKHFNEAKDTKRKAVDAAFTTCPPAMREAFGELLAIDDGVTFGDGQSVRSAVTKALSYLAEQHAALFSEQVPTGPTETGEPEVGNLFGMKPEEIEMAKQHAPKGGPA